MRDRVTEAVCEDIKRRSEFGQKKYGTTLERTDIDLVGWLEHAYFECLDQSHYLKRTIMELKDELKEVKNLKCINCPNTNDRNTNDGNLYTKETLDFVWMNEEAEIWICSKCINIILKDWIYRNVDAFGRKL